MGILSPEESTNPYSGAPRPLTNVEIYILRQMIAERQTNVAELEAENDRLREALSKYRGQVDNEGCGDTASKALSGEEGE